MKKKDEKETHQQKEAQMIKSAVGSASFLHKITKANTMERRCTDLEERRRGCQAVGPL